VWIKKPYRSYKGFKWVWKPEKPTIPHIDATGLTKPQAYNYDYAIKHRKKKKARQYKNSKSAITLVSKKGDFYTIINKPVEKINARDIKRFLDRIGVKRVQGDLRYIGLEKLGIEYEVIPKNKNACERRYGYKRAIHGLNSQTSQPEVENLHIEYLDKHHTYIHIS